ncbi:hypothetical protein GCM10010912_52850 [Paenibacillus albidus]|uniref:Uncharacterized protein n=1 Tax=Paenibacillus albidus TaxID=2041023 RepID=A0A917CXX1_9BACL|nr:hypothetical protein [Paenibacillus albidus]GGG01407.1 hypothetical protein GCM10010912_52850 [Paenibacillus albidus]
MNHPSPLSALAREFVLNSSRRPALTDRELLQKEFRQHAVPLFPGLLDFQAQYGGVCYSFGMRDQHYCILDVMGNGEAGGKVPKVLNHEGTQLVECIHMIRDSWKLSGYMDGQGRLYTLISTTLNPLAESIEHFLEDEAVKYSMVCRQRQWVVKTIYESEVKAWLAAAEKAPLLLAEASRGLVKWWKNHDGRLYVRTQLNRAGEITATAYAADLDDLAQAGYGGVASLQGFPFPCYYNPDRETVELENHKECYVFNHRKYLTADYSRITVGKVRNMTELVLVVTGQRDVSATHPVGDFLAQAPELEIHEADYDEALIQYTAANGDMKILKLISYLADLAPRLTSRRTAAEHLVDRWLYQEFLRRMSNFAEGHQANVHPLYFHPFMAAGLSAEYEIEPDYTVITRLRESSAPTICMLTLFYMKYAQQGNRIAAEVYRIYEPLLMLYSVGGFILKEHGFIEVGGGAFHQGSWQKLIGQEPIDVYSKTAEVWNHRFREYAIQQINRISWNKKEFTGGYADAVQADLDKLGAAFKRMERNLGLKLDEDALYEEEDRPTEAALLKSCPKLQLVIGSAAPLICGNYLRWATLLDRKHPLVLENPCLYEPFLKLLQEVDRMELWVNQSLDLIQHLEKSPPEQYAKLLRKAYQV